MLIRFSRVQLFVTLGTIARKAPLPTGFPRQEYWSGLPCPSPGNLLDTGIEPESLSPALAGGFFTTSTTWEALLIITYVNPLLCLIYKLNFIISVYA